MSTMATLGVFMPNYNHARLLQRAIEAVVTQSRHPDDFLIIDDASTDASVAIIQRYQEKYPFIRLIRHEKNKGLMHTMKTILEHVTTDYIIGAAADDYVLPGFFANAMNLAQQYPQAGIIFGDMVVENEAGENLYTAKSSVWKKPIYASPDKYLHEFLEREPAMHSFSASTIYKTEALREVGGFFAELGPWCDTFAMRAIALRHGACYLASPGAVWSVQGDSVSAIARKNPANMWQYVQKAYQLMRSSKFSGYFPASYARSWLTGYALNLYGGYVLSFIPLSHTVKKRIIDTGSTFVRAIERMVRFLLP